MPPLDASVMVSGTPPPSEDPNFAVRVGFAPLQLVPDFTGRNYDVSAGFLYDGRPMGYLRTSYFPTAPRGLDAAPAEAAPGQGEPAAGGMPVDPNGPSGPSGPPGAAPGASPPQRVAVAIGPAPAPELPPPTHGRFGIHGTGEFAKEGGGASMGVSMEYVTTSTGAGSSSNGSGGVLLAWAGEMSIGVEADVGVRRIEGITDLTFMAGITVRLPAMIGLVCCYGF
ncbi:hypothetical protein [Haliangium sp.]|uniref:hypothetical protein n=1 Tax=Haliangium sp. TaxID=2663208 RepID=UPI003D14CCF1